MAKLTRWTLKVSRETEIGLRTLLAARGRRKGDLARFVEDAVNRAVLSATVRDIRARTANVDSGELARLIDDELQAMRTSFWGAART